MYDLVLICDKVSSIHYFEYVHIQKLQSIHTTLLSATNNLAPEFNLKYTNLV